MLISLTKASGKSKCRHPACQKLPAYIDPNTNLIIKDTLCATIQIDTSNGIQTAYYCRPCCQLIHDAMRQTLNVKLLTFA